jgi:hypothetical protein
LFQAGWVLGFAGIYLFISCKPEYSILSLCGEDGIFVTVGILITHMMRWVLHRVDLLLKPLNKQVIGFVLPYIHFCSYIFCIEIGAYNLFNLENAGNAT